MRRAEASTEASLQRTRYASGPLAAALMSLAACASQGPSAEESFRAFLPEYEEALSAFLAGDNTAWKALLSNDPESSLFSPFGELYRGPADVAAQYDRVEGRFADGSTELDVEYVTIDVRGDMAYFVAIERGTFRRPDADTTSRGFTRATMIFRREAGAWRLRHRHMDHIGAPDAASSAR